MAKNGPTPKQLRFIEEYTRDWNGTQAAIRAGYSKRSAGEISHQLLKKLEIQEAIKARVAEKSMSADEVLIRLAEQARSTIDEFVDVKDVPAWKVLGLEQPEDPLSPDNAPMQTFRIKKEALATHGHLVKKLVATRYGPSLELHDGQAALITLAKAHGLLVEKHEVTGTPLLMPIASLVAALQQADSDLQADEPE
jgi:phage terminase small subunit